MEFKKGTAYLETSNAKGRGMDLGPAKTTDLTADLLIGAGGGIQGTRSACSYCADGGNKLANFLLEQASPQITCRQHKVASLFREYRAFIAAAKNMIRSSVLSPFHGVSVPNNTRTPIAHPWVEASFRNEGKLRRGEIGNDKSASIRVSTCPRLRPNSSSIGVYRYLSWGIEH